jgi:hypothetical protein
LCHLTGVSHRVLRGQQASVRDAPQRHAGHPKRHAQFIQIGDELLECVAGGIGWASGAPTPALIIEDNGALFGQPIAS